MTLTPIPKKIESIVICDGCGSTLDIVPELENLPPPWRTVQVPGFVGKHHACCDGCERAVQSMNADEAPTMVPDGEWDEDTSPG